MNKFIFFLLSYTFLFGLCDDYDVCLELRNLSDNSVEVWMLNNQSVSGFEMIFLNLIGEISSVSGGSATTNGFQLSYSNTTGKVLGFSLSGSTIPNSNDYAKLFDLTFNDLADNLCMNSIVISDQAGIQLSTQEEICSSTSSGCTDSEACNYNVDASSDDGSCIFAEDHYDCSGNCLSDLDNDTVCDELEINGCTEPYASNFSPFATEDDGSCEIASIVGCMDNTAFNYNSVFTAPCIDSYNCCLVYNDSCGDSNNDECNEPDEPDEHNDNESCNIGTDCTDCNNCSNGLATLDIANFIGDSLLVVYYYSTVDLSQMSFDLISNYSDSPIVENNVTLQIKVDDIYIPVGSPAYEAGFSFSVDNQIFETETSLSFGSIISSQIAGAETASELPAGNGILCYLKVTIPDDYLSDGYFYIEEKEYLDNITDIYNNVKSYNSYPYDYGDTILGCMDEEACNYNENANVNIDSDSESKAEDPLSFIDCQLAEDICWLGFDYDSGIVCDCNCNIQDFCGVCDGGIWPTNHPDLPDGDNGCDYVNDYNTEDCGELESESWIDICGDCLGTSESEVYYADADEDGYGDYNSTKNACSISDIEGYVANCNDPDDTVETNDIDIYVLGPEWFLDDNDNGIVDEGETVVTGCSAPEGYVSTLDISSKLLPYSFEIIDMYPNPFNPITNIQFSIPHSSIINVDFYNVLGQKVDNLNIGYCHPGYHKIVWDASHLSSGLYIVQILTESDYILDKIILMK